MQLTHKQYESQQQNDSLILVCDGVTGPANQGALFRLADAFGVNEIIFCNAPVILSSSRLKRTARHTEVVVRFRESEDITTTLTQLHSDGFTSVALEITSDSVALKDLSLDCDKKVLVIGGERNGISEDALALIQHKVHIPMYGANSSMNVAQAAAVGLYELVR